MRQQTGSLFIEMHAIDKQARPPFLGDLIPAFPSKPALEHSRRGRHRHRERSWSLAGILWKMLLLTRALGSSDDFMAGSIKVKQCHAALVLEVVLNQLMQLCVVAAHQVIQAAAKVLSDGRDGGDDNGWGAAV